MAKINGFGLRTALESAGKLNAFELDETQRSQQQGTETSAEPNLRAIFQGLWVARNDSQLRNF